MATEEELYKAARLIKENCSQLFHSGYGCGYCAISELCVHAFSKDPDTWPDPEEGGGDGNG